MTVQAAPGDVLAVLATDGVFSKGIRWSERHQGKPDAIDHVIVVTGYDTDGNPIGIEGKPPGAGPCYDIARFLDDPRTRSNHAQPRDMSKLPEFMATCAKALGTKYDFSIIAGDLLDAVQMDALSAAVDRLRPWPVLTVGGEMPGHIVCSNLAAAIYAHIGWDHPGRGRERLVEPGDWWEWSDQSQWNK